MNVTMFGTGYVGLVTGTCFAEMGNDVLCVDIDPAKVDALKRGEIPIYEPGLEQMVRTNSAAGRLRFSTGIAEGVDHGQVLFIAVGTPSNADGSADLQYVLSVARSIGEHMGEPKVVVDKSTVPVGTADRVRQTIAETLAGRGARLSFDVVSNPEFLKEGAAISDFMKPDRIIVGTSCEASAELLDALYAPFNRNHDKVIHMDVRSAELTKYAANVMLATRISLMNELANLAERLGADIEDVRRGIGSDPRIGFNFIYPGTGYGGSCFPKDVKALIHTAAASGYEASIMQGVETVNERQKGVLFDKILQHFDGALEGRTFALWGLAFKPNTDDIREAPSRTVMDKLFAHGARVRAYDPAAGEAAAQVYGNEPLFTLCGRRDETLEDVDGLIIVTEWNEFRSPDFQMLKRRLKQPVIFDGRNVYDPDYLGQLGFAYYGIGRGLSSARN
ncbi:MAG: UDP-glucose/GDP-mannose dehydrogenase family protein [Roseibium album]|uniref:UDP-glucose dehydrogenase family protein n=1 Tax=Roseibium album TaxID=311410 RepID=UPI0032ED0CC8